MSSVNITVADVGSGAPNLSWRWSVSLDGKEVESGLAENEDAAFEAAKPLFDRLRAEMADHARR
ncbi:MAG: hypothetical protein ACK4TP_19475 [Hyphomicrobium sp.]|jgi:hypothetical protein